MNWTDVQNVVAEARNRGAMISNFFQTEGEFDVESAGETTFLFKQEDGFKHLYFFTPSADQFAKDISSFTDFYTSNSSTSTKNFNLIVDVLGPDRIREPIEKAFMDVGWKVLTVLQRMGRSQLKSQVEVEGLLPPSSTLNSQPSTLNSQPDTATKNDIPQVKAWLDDFFVAEQEQLPNEKQIGEWVDKGTLLIVRGKGFVAFDLSPAQLYLRYWFVHPSARGTGVGGALMREMFAAGASTKRQYFWVKTDNENAIKRYQHYGFQFESMKNTVLKLQAASGK